MKTFTETSTQEETVLEKMIKDNQWQVDYHTRKLKEYKVVLDALINANK